MTRNHRLTATAGLALLLGGCAGSAVPLPRPIPGTATPTPAPVATPRPVQNNSLIGQGANSAIRLFGTPRIDVTEGPGRKLQFAGAACILDIYYYTPRQGADPLATHADARTPDGRDANVESCVAALRR